MEDTKTKIESFVESAINRRDNQLLDILWIFSYCIPSMSGYHNNKEAFKKWLDTVYVRNLNKKYVKSPEIKERMDVFEDFLNEMPNFLSKETFDEDNKLLKEILINKTSKMLVQNANNRLSELSSLDKKILSFVLNYIPIRMEDSVKEAEKQRKQSPNNTEKYSSLPDFRVGAEREPGEISHLDINLEGWTYIFNVLFDEGLKDSKFKVKFDSQSVEFIPWPWGQYKEYSFWQLGDELVKMGVGFWTFSMSAKGYVGVDFTIPSFIYDGVKEFKNKFQKPENFEKQIEEIKQKKEKKWKFDLEGTEAISETSESKLEFSIISNLEILEEGLELIGNQYSTSVGCIDVLCKDKNGNFVVVELKKEKGSYRVVGQIQKYMAWVSENLTEDKQVRGIIVVKEADKDLEYAIRGSKFLIDIKVFGQEPPTPENTKYCTNCGKQLQKSAKFCDKCGQNVWL